MRKVSECPKCGAPIYEEGPPRKTKPPKIHFTCECRNQLDLSQLFPPTVPVYVPYPVPRPWWWEYPVYPNPGPWVYPTTTPDWTVTTGGTSICEGGGGYSPGYSALDVSDPPQGGSGVTCVDPGYGGGGSYTFDCNTTVVTVS
jgi:hypothetical protein